MRRTHVQVVVGIQLVILATGGAGRTYAQALQARPLPTKPAAVVRPQFESELSVKFRDDVKARAVNGNVALTAGGNFAPLQQVQQQFGLSFEQSIELPQATLDFVEARAAQMSGMAQPDFGSSMIVTGPAATLEAAANALLALPEVE